MLVATPGGRVDPLPFPFGIPLLSRPPVPFGFPPPSRLVLPVRLGLGFVPPVPFRSPSEVVRGRRRFRRPS